MLSIPHYLDIQLTDGDKVVSPTHWPRSTPQKHYFSASSTHFWYRLSEHQDHSVAGMIEKTHSPH
jgi:hypothetical protein